MNVSKTQEMNTDMQHYDTPHQHAGIFSPDGGMKIFDTHAFPYTAHILQHTELSKS
jgi:hypothetical protein